MVYHQKLVLRRWDRRQCSFSEFAGIDDEGERFVFAFFLHWKTPS